MRITNNNVTIQKTLKTEISVEKKEDANSQIKGRISLYFDNALNEQDQSELLHTIQNNPSYTEMFNQEKKVREQLKHRLQRPHMNNDLVKRIRDHINLSQ